MSIHKISIPAIGPKASDILLWRDVKKSGICFVSSVATLLTLLLNTRSPAVLALYASSIIVMTALFWSTGAKVMNKPGPPVPQCMANGLSDEEVRKLSDKLRGPINAAAGAVGKVLSGTDPKLSVKAFVALIVSAWVLEHVNLLVLSLVLVVLAFSLPKGYETKKDDVDKFLDVTMTKLNEIYKAANEAVFKKIPVKHPKKSEPSAKAAVPPTVASDKTE